ncbi:RNA polymerase sigma-70 factor (ECF subfamily) [Bacillus iocasae]|uniref:RNA polymerase sigma-70 factor (ECF subfamily) n=1 Tax=Priestia iocasae TaxID=2291674 RepID=A0ABS2QWE6_9BACI|nr:sigma-70 family RNA polymerase sigma factor [Metabacillus iocasae]MBM7702799.1 RNA polymerase sigma-70 factor (ECF subfamily) [Metabacillus iocasae]
MNKEKKWIKLIQKKSDEHAANELVSMYYSQMYGFVYKQTINKELALDLTQEIFISMLQSIHHFEGKRASFKTWLYKIATNRIVDYYRSRHYKYDRMSDAMEELFISGEEDFTVTLERKEEVERVTFHINELDLFPQQILRLKLFADYTFAEIATTLDVPESSVKTKYYATIRTLKRRLEEQNDEKRNMAR